MKASVGCVISVASVAGRVRLIQSQGPLIQLPLLSQETFIMQLGRIVGQSHDQTFGQQDSKTGQDKG